ncbi:hypothetical protein [uncultured Marivirga sp.]|uniref:hypothetical protein n=1 Tax=uncultured Marivirga sp. TaxID=1123707 RepID=UPI0030ED202F
MKFFLVISIIAFWWVPMNSPGNIGISTFLYSTELLAPMNEINDTTIGQQEFSTKRKMDHFGFRSRRDMLINEID